MYFSFGNQGLYTIYGKAIFMSNYTNYTTLPNLTDCFGIFWNYQNYSLAKLSLLAQNSGAVGAIFVSQNEGWKIYSLPSDSSDKYMVNIIVIGMLQKDANSLARSPGKTWMMYKYDLKQSQYPLIKLYISGNYTEDKVFTKELQQLNSIIPLSKANFGVYLDLPYSQDSSLNMARDCMEYYYYNYLCLRGSLSVNGKDKVNNVIMILKYFDYITDLSVFFTSLMNLYNFCEFDYSQKCISDQLSGITSASTTDLYKYSFYDYYSYGYEFTRYTINKINTLIPKSLHSAYCLSFNNPPSECTPCSANCSFSSIQNGLCDTGCNVSSCGYDNLNCIISDKCYNFLLGDGQCDSVCSNDPDCILIDTCSPGCLYSDMKKYLCPLECTGSCFSNCSREYCSPGCKTFDLWVGICSSNCTDACLEQCFFRNTCKPGCLRSEMQKGLCPLECTGFCFSYCSSAYCSPGCLYQDLFSGICSSNCTSDCLKNCADSNICTSGCLYSDMISGLCPLACSGSCFSLCTSEYCSPDCLYKDLSRGICSTNCTSSCLKLCFTNDTCAIGCLYSDMKRNLCPLACSGACFSNCSKIYCSPDCLYKDLNAGVCSSSCTPDCLAKCVNVKDKCKSKCLYSDMAKGLCPASCQGECFKNCDSSIYCSPGCTFKDLKSGNCSTDCSYSCLNNCTMICSDSCHKDYKKNLTCPDECDIICCRMDKSNSKIKNSSVNIIIISVVSVFSGVVFLSIICGVIGCCFVTRNSHRRFENSFSSIVIPEIILNPEELRPIRFKNDIKFVADAVCTIDMLEFNVGDDVILTPCLHQFHPICIKEWLEAPGREKRCPNCDFALDGVEVSLIK